MDARGFLCPRSTYMPKHSVDSERIRRGSFRNPPAGPPRVFSSADDMKTFIANNLRDEYRYLAPDLAAHGDALEATYRGAAHEAEEIHSYLTSHDASNLKLGFGASLEGVVLPR